MEKKKSNIAEAEAKSILSVQTVDSDIIKACKQKIAKKKAY